MNARIDLAIIAGLAEQPNDNPATEPAPPEGTETAHRFRWHLARLVVPLAAARLWTENPLHPCHYRYKPDSSA